MIGYYTDNEVSQGVMTALHTSGIDIAHIRDFNNNKDETPIFYGILRGSGMAMRWCRAMKREYYYIDNGYFDAVYANRLGIKKDTGKYRIVKNDMLEEYKGEPSRSEAFRPIKVLIMPPSPYTAFMYDTIPYDWMALVRDEALRMGCYVSVREKSCDIPLKQHIAEHDAVFAFNSIAVMAAIELGKAVYTTHGIIRNQHMFNEVIPYYKEEDIKSFYEKKQYTLDEIQKGGLLCHMS